MAKSEAVPVRIGIVAGEASGDALGARLLRAVKSQLPHVVVEGIGGPQMQAEGCTSLFPMEQLSVFGLTEIVGHYRDLKRIRQALVSHFSKQRPDVFIGVDSPGFNLGLEEALRARGIRTVHFVSPQVWAWRTWRVHQIRRAVDRMLVMFPFEVEFYARHGIEAVFVGHPLADEILEQREPYSARLELGLDSARTTVALLPGSRVSELKAHARLFADTAAWLHAHSPQLQFVSPFINAETRRLFEAAQQQLGERAAPVLCLNGRSRDALIAADVVVCASGTATLETLLVGRPMVVTYRVSWVTSWLVRMFSHLERYAMPNHLAGRALVPELLQRDAVPEKLGAAVMHYLESPKEVANLLGQFREIALSLRGNAAEHAAAAVIELLGEATVH
ncbi:MAG: lipid-A-disaccharide synthase [Pseudomonadota bacterium]|nr:MAG: lipid-A-disaccharide synthase [Pseudomonadota bacterium]